MFDFAWSELLVIGTIALVVIGPKDLPKALRQAGVLVRRARSLAREFQNSVDDMIRESELDDIRRSVQETTRLDLDKHIENAVDPGGEIKAAFAPELPHVPETPQLPEAPELSGPPTLPEPAEPPPEAPPPHADGKPIEPPAP